MLCRLQGGVHANGALLLLSPSRLESTEIHLCHVHVFTGGLEMRRRAGAQKQEKPRGQSRALSCMKAGLQNLISLTALAAGFKRVWVCWVH